MRKFLATLLPLVMLMTLCAFAAGAEESNIVVPGDAFPDFTAETLDGTFTLSEALEGKEAALVIFWATYCGPCEHEFPFIEQVYETLGDKLAIVALSTYQPDDMDTLAEYRDSHGLTFPIGRDEDRHLYNVLDKEGVPISALIDRFGNLVYINDGAFLTEDAIYRMLDFIMGDDYTESVTLTGIPNARTAVEYPEDEALTEALGGAVSFSSDPQNYDWPWIPEEVDGRAAAVASNVGTIESQAIAHATIDAVYGDVLAFDYKMLGHIGDYLKVLDNGETVKYFVGERDWSSYAMPLTPGSHDIDLVFQRRGGSNIEYEDIFPEHINDP